MSDLEYMFEGDIWKYSGKAAWYFITVPEEISGSIKAFSLEAKRGFGSVRIKATIGQTRWATSVFPDKQTDCYFLPIKADIRKREKLKDGDNVSVKLELDVG